LFLISHEQSDGNALPNIKHILVFTAIGRGFLFQAVTVQIENIDLVKGFHQTLTHAAKGRIIQVTVIGDHSHNTVTRLLDFPLGEAQKFDVIILQPFRIFFTEWLVVHFIKTLRTVNIFFE